MKEGTKEYKDLITRIRKFCMSYGHVGYLRVSDYDRRKLPFQVVFYYGKKQGFSFPHLGHISILSPYLDQEKVLYDLKVRFPSLFFRPDFIAGNRRIEVYIRE